jgi:hypothetical protein
LNKWYALIWKFKKRTVGNPDFPSTRTPLPSTLATLVTPLPSHQAFAFVDLKLVDPVRHFTLAPTSEPSTTFIDMFEEKSNVWVFTKEVSGHFNGYSSGAC